MPLLISPETPQVNCNIYRSKTDVWLSGGPRGNQPALENGTYFFSILAPGGQADPRDGTISNLSDMCSTTTDRKGNPTLSCPTAGKGNNGANQLVTAISNADGDRWFERMFEVQDGKIVGVGPSVAESMYGAAVTDQSPAPRCTHDYILPSDNLSDGPTAARYGLIRAAHFDDTPNNGMSVKCMRNGMSVKCMRALSGSGFSVCLRFLLTRVMFAFFCSCLCDARLHIMHDSLQRAHAHARTCTDTLLAHVSILCVGTHTPTLPTQ